MPGMPPLKGADFYNDLPTSDHRTGDIWHGLPTFGMLNRATAPGVVITPACDLANRKSETVTYLPIIPISEYLSSPACRYECWQEITKALEKCQNFGALFAPSRYDLLSDSDLLSAIGDCTDSKGRPLSAPEVERLNAYKTYVKASRGGTATLNHVQAIFKADRFDAMLFRIVTNAFKSDIHFLPADAQGFGARPVPVHSVVLFRYPLTVPISLLDLAQSITETQWKSDQLGTMAYAAVTNQMPDWPVKLASLRTDFLGDLISRYIGVHIRLGSDDFTEQTVRQFCMDIGGE